MATYVYGIARGDHPDLPEGLTGIGDPPLPVRLVREGDLAAVVSDSPDNLRPKRRDLLAHQHVLAEAGAEGDVLPLRFGSASEDDEAVRRVLTEQATLYRQQLDELSGRVEYNIKAAHREEEVLRLVLAQEDDIRALNEANRKAGGGSYEDRMRLGEMVAHAVQTREAQDARRIEEALTPRAERTAPGPEGSGYLANLSFLLPREEAARFVEAADTFARENGHLELLVNGPLPPYSFVKPVTAAGQPA
ncbi:GvpL/GvpF family gas vesicle protein [Streptomyces sp. NPDC059740]|uniref:GvpL/GvpF family gas vesicle protein n=1 Tax=Streptomyces sp. NPDC059740 TaxID=3346926 RepID=UPI00365FC29A